MTTTLLLEDNDEFRPTTEGETIIIALGWAVGDFWDEVGKASETGLREALSILKAPHPDDKTDIRIGHAIEYIENEFEKRGLEP